MRRKRFIVPYPYEPGVYIDGWWVGLSPLEVLVFDAHHITLSAPAKVISSSLGYVFDQPEFKFILHAQYPVTVPDLHLMYKRPPYLKLILDLAKAVGLVPKNHRLPNSTTMLHYNVTTK